LGAGSVKTESNGRPEQEPLDLFSKVKIQAMSRLDRHVTESESSHPTRHRARRSQRNNTPAASLQVCLNMGLGTVRTTQFALGLNENY